MNQNLWRLAASLLAAELFGQTASPLKTSVLSNGGGDSPPGAIQLTSIVGQASPIAINFTGRDTLFSGFLYTFDIPSLTFSNRSAEPPLPSAGQAVTVKANIVDEFGLTVKLNYRRGGEANFTMIDMRLNGNLYQAEIPTGVVTSRGVEYFITATNSRGFTGRDPANNASIQVQVGGEGERRRDLQGNDLPQPSGDQRTAYRLISVPLDVIDPSPAAVLEDDLSRPYDNTKWRLFGIPANNSQGYTNLEYTKTTLEMKPGRAFWLIVKDASKVIDTGPGKSNLTEKPLGFELRSEWNGVGVPFNFTVPLKNLRRKSGRPVVLRDYSGSYNDPVSAAITEMKPFEGFLLFNENGAIDSLFIDPDLSPRSASLGKTVAMSADDFSWAVHILAQCQEARDVDNWAMTTAAAAEDWDERDLPEPPPIGDYVSVYFPHPEWKKTSASYCLDIRPENPLGQVWSFEVCTSIHDQIRLTFEERGNVPSERASELEHEIWLVDEALQVAQNLREQNTYAVAGAFAAAPKRLKLVVGKNNFVHEKLVAAGAIPTAFELSQNFPNPFSVTATASGLGTTIRYGLPQPERVSLKVYNLQGQEIRTLFVGQRNVGRYLVSWDGANASGEPVASGVYLIRLQAGQFAAVRKIVLAK